jgi:DNA-binding NarL/FixJ family response regulator
MDSAVQESRNRNDGLAQYRLSNREEEVLRLIAQGVSSQEAANYLCCSKRTVDSHLSSIYLKLNVSNRIQVIRRAISMGLAASLCDTNL